MESSKKRRTQSSLNIFQPKTEKDACMAANGTQWCNIQTSKFNGYHKNGQVYIITPNIPERNGEKYRLQIEVMSFLNENNEKVSLTNFVEKFPEMITAFNPVSLNLKTLQTFDDGLILFVLKNVRLFENKTVVFDKNNNVSIYDSPEENELNPPHFLEKGNLTIPLDDPMTELLEKLNIFLKKHHIVANQTFEQDSQVRLQWRSFLVPY